MIATAKAWLTDLERFLLPNGCLCCGRLVERHDPDAVLCGVCRSRLQPLTTGCARCAQPLPPVGPCRFCQDWTSLAFARSAVWLGREARAAVHGLKYGGYTRLGAVMADVIARHLPRPNATLVPVPLGTARLKARGYNQGEAIARALGRRWGLPVEPGLVVRTRETASQITLDPSARRANVGGAFRAQRGPKIVKETVVLIDDVLTTGATLLAAGAALEQSGWSPPGAITFARALDAGGRITASR